ncbi:MAG: hypothetical protein WBV94_02690 [Blastocatellia bacterium]
MDIANITEYDTENLLADDETWLIFLEPAFCKDPTGSDTLAHLLFTLKEAIESGPDGRRRAVNTLLEGIRLVYLYTEEHKLGLKLYLLYLTGHLKPQDEPCTLLSRAIKSGRIEIEQEYKRRHVAKGKHPGNRGTSRKKRRSN